MQINQYANEAFQINDEDFYDVDYWTGSAFETRKISGATLKSILANPTAWGDITGTLSDQLDLQTALDAKQDALVSGTTIKTIEGQSILGAGNIDLNKSDVGLSNVDNTSDLNKPISTATQNALDLKQDLLSLTTTGTSGPATLIGDTLNIPDYTSGNGDMLKSVYDPQDEGIVIAAKKELVSFVNKTGSTVTEGTIVYLKTSSASGTHPEIELADASTEATSSKTIGAVFETTANDAIGYIVTSGEVDNLDTSAYTIGTRLWLSTTAGQVTTTPPTAPDHAVFIGTVTRSQNGNGRILYAIQNGYELGELHNVDTTASVTTPVNADDLLIRENSSSLWKKLSWTNLKATLKTYFDTLYGPGTVSSVGLTSGTTGTDVNITGSPVVGSGTLNINIPTASAANTGKLSSTDWTTFNNKQAALVSGTNIKTIEGQSLLGSGNIDLSKADVGLSNVDNTSDLNKPISTATQTALNAKQDLLVSGTNIKTINGSTVLGSGDLSQSINDMNDVTVSSPLDGQFLTYEALSGQWKNTAAASSTQIELDPVINLLNTPPASPTDGDRYRIGTAPTGVWVGKNNQVAQWNAGTSAWVYTVPVTDNIVFQTATSTTFRYNGTGWVQWAGTPILQNGNTLGNVVKIGTTDNFNVEIYRNNVRRFIFGVNGFYFAKTNIGGSLVQSAYFNGVGLTDNRSLTIPDKDGTLATLDDLTKVTIRTSTINTTLQLNDAGNMIEMNLAAANNLTIPTYAGVQLPIGTVILISQYGAGQTTVVPAVGVTLRSNGGKTKLAGQYSQASLTKRGTDEWYLSGDITL